ncbi:MAG: exonuclease SbcC [Thermosediminibacteraceae bacterium]|nr:exonuclease SbcC [Thermosediminibacteraceae bacterium]
MADVFADQYKQFEQDVRSISDIVKEQHLATEQQIKNSMSQASTNLMDSRRLESILKSAQQLEQLVKMGFSNLKANSKQFRQTLFQMEKQCHEQQLSIDLQVIQAMQEAVSALAKAQSALLQSQAINKVFDSIARCEDMLSQIENSTTVPQ